MVKRSELAGINVWLTGSEPAVFAKLKGGEVYLQERGPVTTNDVARLTAELHRQRLIHTCLTCINFNTTQEVCGLYQVRPPAHVIAYGCPSWQDMIGTQFTPANPPPLTRS